MVILSGGSYWTGGINPGLLWLWAISGNPINNFPAELWFDSPQSSSEEENESNACLKSSYDAAQQRYVLKVDALFFLFLINILLYLISYRRDRTVSDVCTLCASTPSTRPSEEGRMIGS